MLVAVKLEDVSVKKLVALLSADAMLDISNIKFELCDVPFVIQSSISIVYVNSPVCCLIGVINLQYSLNIVDSGKVIEDLTAKGLDGDQLIRIYVDLSFVAFGINENRVKVEGIDSFTKVGRSIGEIVK